LLVLFEIRHLNFITSGCSFSIHLTGEKQYSVKIQQLCGFQTRSSATAPFWNCHIGYYKKWSNLKYRWYSA
jgi:hypothetical protein